MAQLIREIMNKELLLVHPEEEVEAVLLRLLAFKVSGAPVVDASGDLVGVVSWRDLVTVEGTVYDHMSIPALSLSSDASIETAALLLAESGRHRLVVVDGSKPVGVVSTQDVLRALVGFPVQHPGSFPHFDTGTRLVWSDDAEYRSENVGMAPTTDGLVALIQGGAGTREQVVWAEACENIQRHLQLLLSHPGERIPHLVSALGSGSLRFRFSMVPDVARRMTGLRAVLYRARDERRAQLRETQGARYVV